MLFIPCYPLLFDVLGLWCCSGSHPLSRNSYLRFQEGEIQWVHLRCCFQTKGVLGMLKSNALLFDDISPSGLTYLGSQKESLYVELRPSQNASTTSALVRVATAYGKASEPAGEARRAPPFIFLLSRGCGGPFLAFFLLFSL